MNAWNTPNAETIDTIMARKLRRLADTQDIIDRYDSAHIPVPADLIAEYQTRADSLIAWADMWGFDVSDVLADGPLA